MARLSRIVSICLLPLLGPALADPRQQPQDLGPFSTVADIGSVSRKTIATYDRSSGIYFVSAAGDNIWGERDAFGFVFREMKGDASIGARVRFMSKGGHAHRKAGVMLRQSQAAAAVYVDAVVHGDGLTSLQYRAVTAGPTREIQCATEAPTALRLEKRGDYVQLFTANEDGVFAATGCQVKIALGGRFLAGLVVCAHDDTAFENARFSSVTVGMPPERRPVRISAIELADVETLSRRILWYSASPIEVPSFTARGDAICFREGGQLSYLPLAGRAEPRVVGADNLAACETAVPPISAAQRLVNRIEAGRSAIYLEPSDGKPQRLIADKRNHFSPRIAPDARSFAYLSSDARPVDGRPAAADYLLVRRSFADGAERVLADFHGGAGSLGVSPWSADGRRIVFVSREPGFE